MYDKISYTKQCESIPRGFNAETTCLELNIF